MTGDDSEPTGEAPEQTEQGPSEQGPSDAAADAPAEDADGATTDSAPDSDSDSAPDSDSGDDSDAAPDSDSGDDSDAAPDSDSGDDSEDVPPVLLSEVDLPPPASVPVPRAPTPPTVLPAATIVDVSPSEGSVLGGTKITIVGDHLHRASIVRVGGVLAAVVGAEEPRELKVLVPEHHTPGEADLSIQNPGAELTVVPKAFRYVPLPTPKIVAVAPNYAAPKGGTELAITGEGFVKGCSVLVDGQKLERVQFVDAHNLEFKAPAGKNGKMVDVVVENPDGKKARAPRAFVYDERYG